MGKKVDMSQPTQTVGEEPQLTPRVKRSIRIFDWVLRSLLFLALLIWLVTPNDKPLGLTVDQHDNVYSVKERSYDYLPFSTFVLTKYNRDGKKIWERANRVKPNVIKAIGLVRSGDGESYLLFHDVDYFLSRFDRAGRLKWSKKLNLHHHNFPQPRIYPGKTGVVIIGINCEKEQIALLTVNAQGVIEKRLDHAPVKLGDYANIALDRQQQWLLQTGDTLMKWRPNGAIHWRTLTTKTFSAFHIETDPDNNIYLSDPFTLIKFAPSGKLQWSRACREVMLDGPNFMSVGPHGYVYTFGKVSRTSSSSIVLNQ